MALKRMTKADHPQSLGAFKPVGHVVVAMPDDRSAAAAVQALLQQGFEPEDILEYTAAEENDEMDRMLQHTSEFAGFGYEIVNVLVTDIVPDGKVKAAMNDINAAQREQVAANARGEAEKILVVKKAEAEAEIKALQGQGVANQRRAIIEGLSSSIEGFQKVLGSSTAGEVMQLVLVTQYFDTLKAIGETGRTNTVFVNHTPGAVADISQQIMESLAGSRAAE